MRTQTDASYFKIQDDVINDVVIITQGL